ncbi:MAG TPA: HPr family phosphocarrier protein [Acidobacteriota bacterium]|nr:HPr family phosphocarrier protein [Acidobacteriota bacterium]
MIERRVKICNELGLHARAAAKMVKLAGRFNSQITLQAEGRPPADGRSILSIVLLAAGRGTEVTLRAEGEDEGEASKALVSLVESRFGEEK